MSWLRQKYIFGLQYPRHYAKNIFVNAAEFFSKNKRTPTVLLQE